MTRGEAPRMLIPAIWKMYEATSPRAPNSRCEKTVKGISMPRHYEPVQFAKTFRISRALAEDDAFGWVAYRELGDWHARTVALKFRYVDLP